jgi:hypothetical protein
MQVPDDTRMMARRVDTYYHYTTTTTTTLILSPSNQIGSTWVGFDQQLLYCDGKMRWWWLTQYTTTTFIGCGLLD